MVALRLVKSPENGRIIIDLPGELQSQKKVEVIILPLKVKTKKNRTLIQKNLKASGKIWISMLKK